MADLYIRSSDVDVSRGSEDIFSYEGVITAEKAGYEIVLAYENQSFSSFASGTDRAFAILPVTSELGFRLPRSIPPMEVGSIFASSKYPKFLNANSAP